MEVIGFLNHDTIDEVLSVSDNYMLFYLDIDKSEDDVRAMNYIKYGNFFELKSGNIISLGGLLNFKLLNADGKLIFDSEDKINDDTLIMKYGVIRESLTIDTQLN